MIAKVILDIKNGQVNKSFDYLIPSKYLNIVKVGTRVFVPFANRKVLGIVIKLTDEDSVYNLKEIIEVLDLEPILSNEMIELGQELSRYYFSFLIENYLMMIPSALHANYQKIIKVINKDNLNDDLKKLFKNTDYILFSDSLDLKQIIKEVKNKNLEFDYLYKEKGKIKTEKYIKLILNSKAKNLSQQKILDYLSEINEDVSLNVLTNDLGYSKSSINTLNKNGFIYIYEKEIYRNSSFIKRDKKNVILNDEQKKVYKDIKEDFGKFNIHLIHGVCGSGKTEIYLNLIEDVIKEGKSALMLVPEISLTPQMASRFKDKFDSKVAIIHSELSKGIRYDEWRRIKKGEAKIVVGPRSALFQPLNNLGIIIMDEEQEGSYIQENNPRYDSKFVAKFRAIYNKCPLVLGSATPNVVSYYNALNNNFKLHQIKKRANNKPLPKSIIVDMANELKQGNRSPISNLLKDELVKAFNNNEQSVLLLNRKGYSTFVMCRSCGEAIKCPHCDVSLTYHKATNTLKCHYCNFQMPMPKKCPNCGSGYIKYMGDGTEKIEQLLNELIPEAKIIRMDSDTVKPGEHDKLINDFEKHKADILLGTQMVAKGLDFNDVSLVGILNPDLGLKMPFYDAYEKTFDLISQASGRAGRKDLDGKVIIQTYSKDHKVIKYAASNSYLEFYNYEILNRKLSNRPPFKKLIKLVIQSKDSKICYNEAALISSKLKENKSCKVLGPTSDIPYKLNDFYRLQINIIFNLEKDIEVLYDIAALYQNKKDVYLNIIRM